MSRGSWTGFRLVLTQHSEDPHIEFVIRVPLPSVSCLLSVLHVCCCLLYELSILLRMTQWCFVLNYLGALYIQLLCEAGSLVYPRHKILKTDEIHINWPSSPFLNEPSAILGKFTQLCNQFAELFLSCKLKL